MQPEILLKDPEIGFLLQEQQQGYRMGAAVLHEHPGWVCGDKQGNLDTRSWGGCRL